MTLIGGIKKHLFCDVLRCVILQEPESHCKIDVFWGLQLLSVVVSQREFRGVVLCMLLVAHRVLPVAPTFFRVSILCRQCAGLDLGLRPLCRSYAIRRRFRHAKKKSPPGAPLLLRARVLWWCMGCVGARPDAMYFESYMDFKGECGQCAAHGGFASLTSARRGSLP